MATEKPLPLPRQGVTLIGCIVKVGAADVLALIVSVSVETAIQPGVNRLQVYPPLLAAEKLERVSV
jgi:hypothetical protein